VDDVRVRVTGMSQMGSLSEIPHAAAAAVAAVPVSVPVPVPAEYVSVCFNGNRHTRTPLYRLADMENGQTLQGPAIIIQVAFIVVSTQSPK